MTLNTKTGIKNIVLSLKFDKYRDARKEYQNFGKELKNL